MQPLSPPDSPTVHRANSQAASAITAAVDRVLLREFLSKELKLAYVRALVLSISTPIDGLVFLFPQTLIGKPSVPPTIFLIGFTATAIAYGVVFLLHHSSDHPRMRSLGLAIPLFDGLLLAIFITNIWYVLGQSHPQIITNITAFCSLLAVSGGMRLYRRASLATTLIALTNFAYAAVLFQLEPTIALFAFVTILGTGLLGVWMASIVRRQVKNEAGRVVMERFLPKTVVETAFEAPLELLRNPRSCDVTVMITDLRGFTQFAEKREPSEVLAFLSQVQDLQARLVEQSGGRVDKFMGDGMLAVFGAPEPLDNHADRALQAAIALLQTIKHLSPLPIGIGLHSGKVVAGCLGTDHRLEFTVLGDTVNVASRIEALTKELGYPLLISAATQTRCQFPGLISLGPTTLRGREETLELFTLEL